MTREEMTKLLSADPDSYTVQSCCLAYGGSSFSGPIKDALICHLSILRAKLVENLEDGLSDAEHRAMPASVCDPRLETE
jgi:hypothetical protein